MDPKDKNMKPAPADENGVLEQSLLDEIIYYQLAEVYTLKYPPISKDLIYWRTNIGNKKPAATLRDIGQYLIWIQYSAQVIIEHLGRRFLWDPLDDSWREIKIEEQKEQQA